LNSTFSNILTPRTDRLLLGRIGGEAGRGPAAEMPERSQLSARTEFPFATVLPHG